MAAKLEDAPGQTSPGEQTSTVDPAIAQSPTPIPQSDPATIAASTPAPNPIPVPAAGNPALTGVDGDLASRVSALIAASHGRINVQSGFRTLAQQTKLYDRLGPRLAAAPGTSNHERGMAVDLGGDYALIGQLAPQFGLSLPMSWEPWHVELPGQHKASTPNAYTPSPHGDPNPTADPSIESSPQHVLATAVSAMRGLSSSALGELTGPGGSIIADASGTASGAGMVGTTGGESSGGAATYSTTAGQGQGGQVKPGDLYKMLRANGVDPVHAAALVSIAGRESGFNPSAYNGNVSTGDNSHGLFQINTLGGQHAQYDLQSLGGQVSAAADMVKHGGLQPWGPYKGMPWANGTNLATGADASGGEVTLDQLKAIVNEGLH